MKKRGSPMEKGWIEFSITSLEPGGNSEQNGNIQIAYFLRQFHYGAKSVSQPASKPAYSLAIFIG